MVAIVSALITSFALITVANGSQNSDSGAGSKEVKGVVENPFQKGCLKVMAEESKETDKIEKYKERVCNSDDIRMKKNYASICRLNTTHQELYQTANFEVRIESSDFEESIILGWIYQILLSEVLDIPATIEGKYNDHDTSIFSFYYHERSSDGLIFNSHKYSDSINSLVKASRLEDGDCTSVIPKNEKCAHIIPSVYAGGKADAKKYVDNGEILGDQDWNGIRSRIGYFIPRRTKDQYPSFDYYRGLQGTSGEKLAEIFKTPKTWGDFCTNYSKCEDGNDIASRPPETKEEEESYFVESKYNGYFHYDNCTKNCSGNIIVPSCHSTNYAEAQLFWNNISLTSKGPKAPNNGYGDEKLNEIYNAANANQEDVIIWGYTPDLTEQKYLGTDYEWHRVDFPRPNSACTTYRKQYIDRCDEKVEVRRGDKITGFCDYGEELPTKLFSKGIEKASLVHPEAKSPAFDLLKDLIIDPVPEVFSLWNINRNKYKNGEGIDPERQGVCQWVYDNYDILEAFLPRGFPENPIVKNYAFLSTIGLVVGSFAMLVVIISFVFIYRWRDKRTMRFAQVDALLCTTIGYGFLTMAAITYATEPSTMSCTLTQWFTRLGYALAIVPILTKISAINNLTRSGLRLQRAEINHWHFRIALGLTISILVTYLTIWSSLDAPSKKVDYSQVIESEVFEHNIHISYGCSSKSMVWETIAFFCEAILLLAATILTIQSSNVFPELDESIFFAFLVYSHFLFLIMRTSVFVLMRLEMIPKDLCQYLTSLVLSFDTIVAILIYFGPKFHIVMKAQHDDNRPSSRFGVSMARSKFRSIPGVRIPEGGIPNLINTQERSNGASSTILREGNNLYLSVKKEGDSVTRNKKVCFSSGSGHEESSTNHSNEKSNEQSDKRSNEQRSILKCNEIQDVKNEIISLTQSKKMTETTSSKLQSIILEYVSFKNDIEENSLSYVSNIEASSLLKRDSDDSNEENE